MALVKAFLIVRTGSALPHVIPRLGDFHDWFVDAMGLDPSEVRFAAPFRDEPLPAPHGFTGIVLTGSSDMVTDRALWMLRLADWLREAVGASVPILGVCFGHQILAHALGGEVGENPRGRQIGTALVHLTSEGSRDPLLSALPDPATVQETHVQSVLRAPEGAVVLARDPHDPHQALRYAPRAWSVQFHPEMRAEMLDAYIQAHHERLLAEGLDPEALRAALRDAPDGRLLLRRFVSLARS